MDKNKIEEKRNALLVEIDALQSLLDNPEQMQTLIKTEITELSDKFNSPRQTPVMEMALENYNKENFVVDEEVLIQLTKAQYLKVLPTDTFREQNRGGKGVKGLDTKDDDYVHTSMVASSHDFVYAFTNTGRIFKSRVFDLPQGSRTGRGQNLVNYFNLQEGEKITNILTVSKKHEENSEGSLVFLTKNGTVKRTLMSEYAKVRQSGLIAINIKDEDKLVEVAYSHEETDKVIISADNGRTVIFTLEALRPLGRATSGVRGINLGIKDSAIALQVVQFEFSKEEEITE
jgi:DNA gyrase subunit A